MSPIDGGAHTPVDTPAAAAVRRRPRVVALGGGHGLHVMLSALVRLPVDITAVVTVADDGGSSGRLRREVPGIVPPGDLRMALTALAEPDDTGALWSSTFQHRFRGERSARRAPGGQSGAGRADQGTRRPGGRAGRRRRDHGRPRAGCCRCRASRWTSSPTSPASTRTRPRCAGIRGQVAVASTLGSGPGGGAGSARRGRPARRRSRRSRQADLLTFGPGSWFTSVLPHLMLPDLAGPSSAAGRSRLVVLNLAAQPGETEGFSPEQHLDVLSEHAPELRIDSVLADRRLCGAAAASGLGRGAAGRASGPARCRDSRHGPARPGGSVGVLGGGADPGGAGRTGPERAAVRATTGGTERATTGSARHGDDGLRSRTSSAGWR